MTIDEKVGQDIKKIKDIAEAVRLMVEYRRPYIELRTGIESFTEVNPKSPWCLDGRYINTSCVDLI